MVGFARRWCQPASQPANQRKCNLKPEQKLWHLSFVAFQYRLYFLLSLCARASVRVRASRKSILRFETFQIQNSNLFVISSGCIEMSLLVAHTIYNLIYILVSYRATAYSRARSIGKNWLPHAKVVATSPQTTMPNTCDEYLFSCSLLAISTWEIRIHLWHLESLRLCEVFGFDVVRPICLCIHWPNCFRFNVYAVSAWNCVNQ